MRLDHLPDFLRPRLRLFMSVDLVGSTALKQSGTFPIKAPKDGDRLRDVGAHWFFDIAGFYGEMEAKFAKHWNYYCDYIAPKYNWPIGESPQLWKSNGDELIYVKELGSSKECIAAILCWKRAATEFRRQLRDKKSKLDVKMSAWTAGFPVTNTEVIFQSSYRNETSEKEDWIPEVLHFYFLETWYSNHDKRNGLVRDFIGPSLDTGFRIASMATSRKFTVSLEIALIIALTAIPRDIDELALRYDGQEILKGVLGGRPYPLFWIDTLNDDDLTKFEDRLGAGATPSKEDIRNYCEEFICRHEAYMLSPFIVGDSEHLLAMVPENYEALVNHLAREWEIAKKSNEIFLKALAGEIPEGEAATPVSGGESTDLNIDLSLPLPQDVSATLEPAQ